MFRGLRLHKLADLTGDKTLEGVQDFVEKVPPLNVLQGDTMPTVMMFQHCMLLHQTNSCPLGVPACFICRAVICRCGMSAVTSRVPRPSLQQLAWHRWRCGNQAEETAWVTWTEDGVEQPGGALD